MQTEINIRLIDAPAETTDIVDWLCERENIGSLVLDRRHADVAPVR